MHGDEQSGSRVSRTSPPLILLVEDEVFVADLMRKFLEMKNLRVICASSVQEAIEHLSRRASEIAVLVCDLGLPDGSGLTVIENAQRLAPDAHIILSSGDLTPHTEEELRILQTLNSLPKPFSPNSLLQKIDEVLESVEHGPVGRGNSHH